VGGDASFYSFYAVLHHMQSLWDRLARRITLCNESLIPLKRAAALEEMVACKPAPCTLLQCQLSGCCWWTLAEWTGGDPHSAPGSQAAPAEPPSARSIPPGRRSSSDDSGIATQPQTSRLRAESVAPGPSELLERSGQGWTLGS